MHKKNFSTPSLPATLVLMALVFVAASCDQQAQNTKVSVARTDAPAYFHLHPQMEKTYGLSQAIKLGDVIKVSGVVSVDDMGHPKGVGDFAQQFKNCYQDIDTVLKHYGCTFEDVVVENFFTTSMSELHKHAAYRSEIYKNNFPAGTWVGVKELGLPEFMIEIEIEAHIPKK